MLTLLHGDALAQLKTLEDESVQTCVTSPPYWGLRDYGLAPSVWDATVDCEHEWESHLQPSANGQTTHAMIAETLNEASATRKPKLSAFCHCGAWRGCFGLEPTPELYVAHLVQIFRAVRRVLRNDGTLWLNLGDSYAGGGNYRGVNSESTLTAKQRSNGGARGVSHLLGSAGKDHGCKPKDLVGIPWMAAFALRADGWYLRSDIIWSKPNPMPESVTDRPTKAHEYIFLLSKSAKYFFDADAVKEPATSTDDSLRDRDNTKLNNTPGRTRMAGLTTNGYETRNIRSVWNVSTISFPDAHFATFPPKLIEPCILAGSKAGDVVLDPFAGSGTTGKVAIELGRRAVLIEPKDEYVEMIERRCKTTIGLPFAAA